MFDVAQGADAALGPEDLAMEGLRADHRVWISGNAVGVTMRKRADMLDTVGGYVLLASAGARARHLTSSLAQRVGQIAEDAIPLRGGRQAAAILRDAAIVQRDAVLARRDMRARAFLGHPRLVTLFEAGSDRMLGAADREGLVLALEGLDRLVNSVFAVASEASSMRLNTVGFVLAVLSLFFGATQMAALATAGERPQRWVLVSWAASAALLALVGAALLLWSAARARSATARHRSPRA
jgi:hypothetical protein